MSIRVRLPGGEAVEVANGALTAGDAISRADRLITQSALVARVDGQLVDLTATVPDGAIIEPVLSESREALEVYRHSSAHLLAAAVLDLYPDTLLGIGPATEEGFYYDFLRKDGGVFTPDELGRIEEKIQELIKEDIPYQRVEMTRDEAARLFAEMGDDLKVELICDKGGQMVSCYKLGDHMIDFCLGPHIPSTGRIKAIKLLNVSAAHWRSTEGKPEMQRIYGTSFFDRQELDGYLKRREEAEKRDHRRLGKELELFMFHPFAPASPFFFPKGAFVYNALVEYVRELYQKYRYEEVITPLIYEAGLWKISGHYEHFWDDMFRIQADEREYAPKPMNCPSHCLMYSFKLHSYRELPIRIADFARLHRYERSGVTQGLTRVRSFSQDDAHIFCRPDQIQDEVHHFLEMLTETYRLFGFEDIQVYLSTRPEHRAGADEIWDRAESVLADVLAALEVEYTLAPGEGAFYGPKVDFNVKDAVGRPWQLGTVQLDFNLPEQFQLEYINESGAAERPVMIHRAMFGSLERFLGVLIEHCAGAFPLWLAPVQVAVLTITEKQNEYAQRVYQRMVDAGFRAELDIRADKIGAKIRQAQLMKVPYMLVVGNREAERGEVAVRQRTRGDIGAMPVGAFIEQALRLQRMRANTLDFSEQDDGPQPDDAGSKEK